MMGDSLTQHFYISSPISLFWRARTERRKNWFLDTDPDPASIHSVYERLATFTPLVATEYNGAGALVASRRAGEGMRRRIVRTRAPRKALARNGHAISSELHRTSAIFDRSRKEREPQCGDRRLWAGEY